MGPTGILPVVPQFGRRDARQPQSQHGYVMINMMRTIIVTGSAGLIGSETVRRFARDGMRVLG
ncbi:MAG: hypothetical protein DMF08_11845, partial [Verrucomicrobia bacterium]